MIAFHVRENLLLLYLHVSDDKPDVNVNVSFMSSR